MSGKLCTGAQTANSGAPLIRDAKAFCEGLAHRAKGTAVAFPITDNPHVSGSQADTAWDAGWTVSDDAVATTVDPADAPCCSVPQNTISA